MCIFFFRSKVDTAHSVTTNGRTEIGKIITYQLMYKLTDGSRSERLMMLKMMLFLLILSTCINYANQSDSIALTVHINTALTSD